MKTIRVGAVDCSSSQAGKQICEREGAGERLPSVRLYADGARDTLVGPSALANGEGSPEALLAHIRTQHGCAASWGTAAAAALRSAPSTAAAPAAVASPAAGSTPTPTRDTGA